MNEELDQVQEVNEEGLFDDYEDTPIEEESNNEETSTEEVETENVETEVNPFLRIKYNGEEMDLNEDDARTLAQKGMNYDRIYEPIERLARMNGMPVGDYLNKLNDTQVQYEVAKEIENLKNNPKYENVSDEVLEEIANNHVMESIGQRDQNYKEKQKGEADAQQAKIQRDIDLFFEEYPEFKNKGPDVLDQKVFDYVRKGYTLLEAYNKWAKEQANDPKVVAQEKTSKLNEENKKKSLGNTTNAGNVEKDDFLDGFLKG